MAAAANANRNGAVVGAPPQAGIGGPPGPLLGGGISALVVGQNSAAELKRQVRKNDQWWSVLEAKVENNDELLEIMAEMCTGEPCELDLKLKQKKKAQSTRHDEKAYHMYQTGTKWMRDTSVMSEGGRITPQTYHKVKPDVSANLYYWRTYSKPKSFLASPDEIEHANMMAARALNPPRPLKVHIIPQALDNEVFETGRAGYGALAHKMMSEQEFLQKKHGKKEEYKRTVLALNVEPHMPLVLPPGDDWVILNPGIASEIIASSESKKKKLTLAVEYMDFYGAKDS